MPWDGGTKVWHDDVFVLEKPDGAWRAAGKLPRTLGYGVAVSHARGVVCVGGSDARRHHDIAFIINWRGGKLVRAELTTLPEPLANLSGALDGDILYVVGGTSTPTATNASQNFYALTLSAKKSVWQKLPPLPGAGRILATAAAHNGSFYLFGGASLHAGADGAPQREWLRETWCYNTRDGWKRLADLPRVAVAAPSPAPIANGRLLILGGDDGAQVSTPPTQHQGFRRNVLAYDPKADRWEQLGEIAFAQVTTTAVWWNNHIVIPSGEIRPGVRSPEVWSAPVP